MTSVTCVELSIPTADMTAETAALLGAKTVMPCELARGVKRFDCSMRPASEGKREVAAVEMLGGRERTSSMI